MFQKRAVVIGDKKISVTIFVCYFDVFFINLARKYVFERTL